MGQSVCVRQSIAADGKVQVVLRCKQVTQRPKRCKVLVDDVDGPWRSLRLELQSRAARPANGQTAITTVNMRQRLVTNATRRIDGKEEATRGIQDIIT